MRNRKSIFILFFVLLLALPLLSNIWDYIHRDLPELKIFAGMSDFQAFRAHISERMKSWIFYTHALMGALALFTSLLQMFRKKGDKFHRAIGRIFFIAFLLSALAGMALAPSTYGGIVATFGFATLGVISLICLFILLWTVRTKDFLAHERWAIRCVALVFSSVTLRIEMALLSIWIDSFYELMQVAAWSSWLGNVVLAEIFLVCRRY